MAHKHPIQNGRTLEYSIGSHTHPQPQSIPRVFDGYYRGVVIAKIWMPDMGPQWVGGRPHASDGYGPYPNVYVVLPQTKAIVGPPEEFHKKRWSRIYQPYHPGVTILPDLQAGLIGVHRMLPPAPDSTHPTHFQLHLLTDYRGRRHTHKALIRYMTTYYVPLHTGVHTLHTRPVYGFSGFGGPVLQAVATVTPFTEIIPNGLDLELLLRGALGTNLQRVVIHAEDNQWHVRL